VTAFTVTDLLEGETYFSTVTAYDIFVNESDFSNEVSTTIPVTEPVNNPPGASFTFSCSDLVCSFTNTSTDSDGSVVAWSWGFGEGASSVEQSPSHTYASDGTYTVTLVVTDDDGGIDTTSQGVTVTSSSGTEPTPEPTCKKGKSCDHSNREKKSKKWGAIK
jgi:PKD repeat protein